MKNHVKQKSGNPRSAKPRRRRVRSTRRKRVTSAPRRSVKKKESSIAGKTTSSRRAFKQYQKFHGRSPTNVTRIKFTYPKYLIRLGRATRVYYVPYRGSGKQSKKGRKIEYVHKMGAGVEVFVTPDKKAIVIMGGKFRVTDWMRG